MTASIGSGTRIAYAKNMLHIFSEHTIRFKQRLTVKPRCRSTLSIFAVPNIGPTRISMTGARSWRSTESLEKRGCY